MRKLIYHVASSLDGFIARENDSFDDFVPTGTHDAEYLEALSSYDAVLMGRRTYEVGSKVGVTDPYPMIKKQYVVSRTLQADPDPRVELISHDLPGRVSALKQQAGGDIYLCGGGTLASELLDHGLIDQLLLKLNPILIGAGIPLFAGGARHAPMKLLESKQYDSGVALLRYQLAR